MASNIDPTKPEEGLTTTADTRANFSAAKTEIEAEQAKNVSQDTDIAGKEPADPNIQAHIADVISNPHAVNKAQVGLSAADNTSDADKPISSATAAALAGKEPTIDPKNTAFNRNFTASGGNNGVGVEVARGDHGHDAAEVGAAPASHVGDNTHLSADERAAMTIAAPTGLDPLITQNDLNAHTADQALHVTPNQNAALDGANAPSGTNVFATVNDLPAPGTNGHVIQDPAGTPQTQRPNLQFTGDVVVTDDAANSRTVVDVTAGAGSGESNTASNLGAGEGVFAGKVAVDLQFKSLLSANGALVLSSNANEITAAIQYAGSSGNFGVAATLARSDHTHNGEFLPVAGKAADSDLLDGLDSTAFTLATDFSNHVAAQLHLPAGGTANQALVKIDGTDYNVQWADVIQDVPTDSTVYARQNGAWVPSPLSPVGGLALSHTFSTAITATDPGAGGVKVNNADQTLATEIYISGTSALGNDASSVIESLRTGDYVGLWEQQSDKESVYYNVTGPVVDNTGWYTVPVSAIPGTAGGIDDATAVTVQVIANEESRLPLGGSTGQVLKKTGPGDYAVAWENETGGGGSAHVIQDEGTPLTQRANLNFVGAGVTATDDSGNNATVVFIPGGGGDLSNAVFPDYAVFDGEVDNAGTNPTVDFSAGNKQRCSNAAIGNITLAAAPGIGNYILRLIDSTTHTFLTTIRWDSGTAPTWAGESIVALYWDGTNWSGSAMVGVA